MLLSIEKRKVCVLSKSPGNVKGCELSKAYMLTISIPESYTKPYVGSDESLPRKELNIIKEETTRQTFSPLESFHPEDVYHAYAADAYPEENTLYEGLDAHAAQRLAGERGSDEEE